MKFFGLSAASGVCIELTFRGSEPWWWWWWWWRPRRSSKRRFNTNTWRVWKLEKISSNIQKYWSTLSPFWEKFLSVK